MDIVEVYFVRRGGRRKRVYCDTREGLTTRVVAAIFQIAARDGVAVEIRRA